jgi:hypothetical protein
MFIREVIIIYSVISQFLVKLESPYEESLCTGTKASGWGDLIFGLEAQCQEAPGPTLEQSHLSPKH